MSVNKNSLIRYKTIDMCLQNRHRKWTLEDLIEACSNALHEFEIGKGVSRRTIQLDLQLMRSDKLGYNAPIIVIDKKCYTYEDPDFSIINSPISESDFVQLSETVELLKQFKRFSYFKELCPVVQKLEDYVVQKKLSPKIKNLKIGVTPEIPLEIPDKILEEITPETVEIQNEITSTISEVLDKISPVIEIRKEIISEAPEVVEAVETNEEDILSQKEEAKPKKQKKEKPSKPEPPANQQLSLF